MRDYCEPRKDGRLDRLSEFVAANAVVVTAAPGVLAESTLTLTLAAAICVCARTSSPVRSLFTYRDCQSDQCDTPN